MKGKRWEFGGGFCWCFWGLIVCLLLVFALVWYGCFFFFLFVYFVKLDLECTFLPGDLSEMLRIAFLVHDINCVPTHSDDMLNDTCLLRKCRGQMLVKRFIFYRSSFLFPVAKQTEIF